MQYCQVVLADISSGTLALSAFYLIYSKASFATEASRCIIFSMLISMLVRMPKAPLIKAHGSLGNPVGEIYLVMFYIGLFQCPCVVH
jgi:hypothetical protein